MVCLLAMQMLGMSDLSSEPPPDTDLKDISKKIVSFLRPFQAQQDLDKGAPLKEFCVCQNSIEELDGDF